MRLGTVLVGTDLTERSDPAIVRGHQIALASDAKLVVCHVGPGHVGSHPLFPQHHQDDVVAASNLEQRIADAVSQRAAEITGRTSEQFDVVVDHGDVVAVLTEHAARLGADLIVVMADASDLEGGGTVTRDLARRSPCSVFAVGEGSGAGVAVVALEDDIETIPALVTAASTILGNSPTKVEVILFVDDPKMSTSRIADRLTGQAAVMGIALVPWFAEMVDTSLVRRAVDDGDLGLVVMAAPVPDNLTADSASPLDEALSTIRSSVLLLRT